MQFGKKRCRDPAVLSCPKNVNLVGRTKPFCNLGALGLEGCFTEIVKQTSELVFKENTIHDASFGCALGRKMLSFIGNNTLKNAGSIWIWRNLPEHAELYNTGFLEDVGQ